MLFKQMYIEGTVCTDSRYCSSTNIDTQQARYLGTHSIQTQGVAGVNIAIGFYVAENCFLPALTL